jgi:hypothetical protein
MNIKEFIKEMQNLQEQHGDDLEVGVNILVDPINPDDGYILCGLRGPFEIDERKFGKTVILAEMD